MIWVAVVVIVLELVLCQDRFLQLLIWALDPPKPHALVVA